MLKEIFQKIIANSYLLGSPDLNIPKRCSKVGYIYNYFHSLKIFFGIFAEEKAIN